MNTPAGDLSLASYRLNSIEFTGNPSRPSAKLYAGLAGKILQCDSGERHAVIDERDRERVRRARVAAGELRKGPFSPLVASTTWNMPAHPNTRIRSGRPVGYSL